MNNWIGPMVKHEWNDDMGMQHIFSICPRTQPLNTWAEKSLHLLLLKSLLLLCSNRLRQSSNFFLRPMPQGFKFTSFSCFLPVVCLLPNYFSSTSIFSHCASCTLPSMFASVFLQVLTTSFIRVVTL